MILLFCSKWFQLWTEAVSNVFGGCAQSGRLAQVGLPACTQQHLLVLIVSPAMIAADTSSQLVPQGKETETELRSLLTRFSHIGSL